MHHFYLRIRSIYIESSFKRHRNAYFYSDNRLSECVRWSFPSSIPVSLRILHVSLIQCEGAELAHPLHTIAALHVVNSLQRASALLLMVSFPS